MANIDNSFTVETLSINDQVLIATGAFDPKTGAGYEAPVGSIFIRQAGVLSTLYVKTGSNDVDWTVITTANDVYTSEDISDFVEAAQDAIAVALAAGTQSGLSITYNDASNSFNAQIAENLVLPGTGSVTVPIGTTSERPASPAEGMLRYNSTTDDFEGYANSTWAPIVDTNDTRLNPKNVLVVQKTPGPGQFSSIKAAVDSVTGNSTTNPFVVLVHPGVYIEDTITMKTGVHVLTQTPFSVIVAPTNPANDLFLMAPSSGLRGLTISGCTNGRAVVALNAAGCFCVENFYNNNHTDIHVEGVSAPAQVVIVTTTFMASAARRYAGRVISNGSSAQLVVTTSFYSDVAGVGTNIDKLFDVTGPSASSSCSASTFLSAAGIGTGLCLSNGAIFSSSGATFNGFNRNVHIENAGAAPILRANLALINGVTYDLQDEHPGTSGYFTGSADRTKVVSDSDLTFAYNGTNTENSGFTIAGNLYMGLKHAEITQVTDLIQHTNPVGLVEGGELAPGVGLSVEVSEGFGYLEDAISDVARRVEWPTTSVALIDNSAQYIYIDNDGVPSATLAPPDYTTTIILGKAFTGGGFTIGVNFFPNTAHHSATLIDEFLRKAVGPIFGTGAIVSESTTPFELDVSNGTFYYSTLVYPITGGSAISFTHIYHTAGQIDFGLPTTLVNNTQYDNMTDLVSLSPGHYTKHVLWLSTNVVTGDYYLLVVGQEEYATLLEAENAPLPIASGAFSEDTVPVAAIIVQEGAANISEIIDIRPRIGFQSPSSSASSDHGNLTGLLDDDHPQYLLTNGSRTLSGNLNLGGNAITNVTTVNSVSVQTHASRHLPNGADPLATAAPANSLTAVSTNDVGIANSFARSDHSHAITGFQPSLKLYAENSTLPAAPTAGGVNSIALGSGAHALGNKSLAIGEYSIARVEGSVVQANGRFGSSGDAQTSFYLLRTSTIDASVSEAFVDGTAGTTRLIMPDNSTWLFRAKCVAHRTDAGDGHAGYTIDGVIYRGSGAGTVALQGSPIKNVIAESNAAWDINIEADSTNGALAVKVKGETGKTIRWLISVETIEVTN